jgi:hypothetical protein
MARVFLSPATFAGGSLAGALLLASWLGAFTTAPAPRADPASHARAASAPRRAAAAAPQPVATEAEAVALAETCPRQPLAARRGANDGHFVLDAALAAGAQIDPAAYVTVAREAAQQGRLRDAEVALLAACHFAEKASGTHSLMVADLKEQMAQQYAAFAASEPPGAAREGLLQRASALLTESAITYSAALGRDAPQTRLAEQRLASLHDPATLQHARAELHGDAAARVMGAAPGSAPPARVPEARTGAASRLIASDPELAQLERDMERLHAQVRSVTRDPAGLRRRDSQALARRDAGCQDKACLLRWYAQRRTQLLDEF